MPDVDAASIAQPIYLNQEAVPVEVGATPVSNTELPSNLVVETDAGMGGRSDAEKMKILGTNATTYNVVSGTEDSVEAATLTAPTESSIESLTAQTPTPPTDSPPASTNEPEPRVLVAEVLIDFQDYTGPSREELENEIYRV
ncbi:MAG TPA: hypothetical protein DCL61_05465, partial [Cyanobacteria bacterium UBA12227]|nr:hypothetical protein [Cyanobacteria bacterium UBA12227]